MIKTILAIVLLACSTYGQFGETEPCDVTVVGYRPSDTVAVIPANCNQGNIYWHYTNRDLTINFRRQGQFEACFTVSPDYRYINGDYQAFARVKFPSLQESEITGTRLNPFTRRLESLHRFCGNFNSVLQSVTANTGRRTYYMVSFPYTITDTTSK